MATYKKSIETQDKIIQTASSLFYEKGYNATTVRDIASAADLSLSRLNYHFNSKAALAGEICKEFLKNFNEELFSRLPIKDEKIIRDTVHIRTWIRIFLSHNQTMDFYYELACANILSEALIESDYRHFTEQAAFLKLDLDTTTLRMYAHIFTASIIELIKAKKEKDITATNEEIIDMCNILHLKLLGIDPIKQEKIISEAKTYASHVQYALTDLSSIRIAYHE
ncbi:TetR family transcriptional regulator [Eubacteriaceae bacterium ES3]|nr:TetR family transcriptional regulator [Eubacteriaceae bacterium ES3]